MTNPFSPSSPPRLHVEPLPANATVASIQRITTDRGKQAVTINAWLPDQWATSEVPTTSNGGGNNANEEFYDNYCEGCEYNCDTRELDWNEVEDMEWQDDNGTYWRLSGATAESPCAVAGSGLSGLSYISWPCYAGHDEPDDDDDEEEDDDIEEDFLLGPMRFSTTRLITGIGSYELLDTSERFTAVLQGATPRDGTWRFTQTRRVCNTYDPSQGICWGGFNTIPRSLAEAAAAYADAECNSDLLPVRHFRRNTTEARLDTHFYVEFGTHLLLPTWQGEAAQAVVLADAANSPDAFLLLAASGAPVKDGIAATTARWVEDLPITEGHTFTGWRTRPLAGMHGWLIGQINTGDGVIHALLGQHSALLEPAPTPVLTTSI